VQGKSPKWQLVFGRELAAPFELMFPGIPENDNIRFSIPSLKGYRGRELPGAAECLLKEAGGAH